MSRRGGGRDGKDRVVIYWERDLYLRCDRSSGHRTKMGKGPGGVCDSMIHEAKDKTSPRQGIKLEAVFHSGPRVRGSCPCQSLTFFFLHSRCLPSLAPARPPNQSILQGRRTAVNEKTPWRKAPRALREFGHPPALILSLTLTETAHLQYRLRSQSGYLVRLLLDSCRRLYSHEPGFG